MDTNELNATIARLHDELTHGQQLDEESRERLRILIDDIRASLERGSVAGSESDSEPEDESLADRVQDAVIDFEAAHPQFSQLMGRLADGLSQLGI